MKTFLMFIALFIVNMSFLVYESDLNRYIQLQTYLKAVAEEAACGAAMYYDEEAYSRGFMVINRTEGEKYLEELLDQARLRLNLKETFTLSGQMETGESDVVVILELECADVFRLPYLTKNRIIRGAKYELARQ